MIQIKYSYFAKRVQFCLEAVRDKGLVRGQGGALGGDRDNRVANRRSDETIRSMQ